MQINTDLNQCKSVTSVLVPLGSSAFFFLRLCVNFFYHRYHRLTQINHRGTGNTGNILYFVSVRHPSIDGDGFVVKNLITTKRSKSAQRTQRV
jgi:hypothetical protein